jgi:hypothetical protein
MSWKDKNKYRSEKYREYIRNYQRDWYQKNEEWKGKKKASSDGLAAQLQQIEEIIFEDLEKDTDEQ